jgi:hypothetical protein
MAPHQRPGCVIASVLVGIPVALVVGAIIASAPRPTAVPVALAESAFARECAEAERLGLALAVRSPTPVPIDRSPASVDLALAPGECVALVAAAWGFQLVDSVDIYELPPGAQPALLSTGSAASGLVAHAQWCADAQTSVRLAIVVSALDLYGRADSTQGYLRMAAYRGSGAAFGGLRGITRGELTERAYRRVPVSSLLAEADGRAPPGASLLGRELSIPKDAASLIPEDAATYRVLWERAGNGTVHAVSPRISPLPLDVPATWRPLAPPGALTSVAALRARVATDTDPGPQFPLFVTDTDARRALVIVDAARLGAPCVELRFVRLLFGHRAAVSRVASNRTTVVPLAQVENEARDRLCAAQGVVAYVVDPEDQEPYRLRLYAVP